MLDKELLSVLYYAGKVFFKRLEMLSLEADLQSLCWHYAKRIADCH